MLLMSRIEVKLSSSPSGENHWIVGSGLELVESHIRCSVSPSLTVVSPVISGALKTCSVAAS